MPKPLPLRSTGARDTPPRVFCQKRLQVIDSKARECGKGGQEAARV